MFRLIIKEPGNGDAVFVSQPFGYFEMHGREVETEYGKMVVREGLQAVIASENSISKTDGNDDGSRSELPAEAPMHRECA